MTGGFVALIWGFCAAMSPDGNMMKRTRAELASIEALIEQLSDEDVMSRLSLESRRDELIAVIQRFEAVSGNGKT